MLPNAGVTTGECGVCGVIDRLPNGARVRMQCWTDGTPPGEGLSPRWFWVTEIEGPTPGLSGYVWADLVAQQIDAPVCDDLRFDFQPAFTDRHCYSNDGPDHWVAASDVAFSPIRG